MQTATKIRKIYLNFFDCGKENHPIQFSKTHVRSGSIFFYQINTLKHVKVSGTFGLLIQLSYIIKYSNRGQLKKSLISGKRFHVDAEKVPQNPNILHIAVTALLNRHQANVW